MIEYEYHRIANIFPLMQGDEFEKLAADIQANGLLDAVVLHEGKILDGRNRYRACQQVGVTPRFVDFAGGDPLTYVISKNRHRRHLTSGQLAAIAVTQEELMAELEAEARARQATSKPGIYGGEPLTQIVEEAVGETAQRTAEIFGTNRQYVQDAKRLRDNAPDLLEKVAGGEVTLPEAKREFKEREKLERKQERAQLALVVDETAAEPVLVAPMVKAGEWWQLGDHLLYCGDTSTPAFTNGVDNAAFAFADPPYNAEAAEWDSGFVWKHDWLHMKAPVVAVTPGIVSIFEFARQTKMPYAWSMACWITNGMTRGALGFGNWIYTALFSKESLHRNAQDFMQVSIKTSENGETAHKGRKPSEMLVVLLGLFTKEGDTVIDPFLGSGTTLLVSEQMGRACIGGEINPDYCREIIARWQGMTGKQAARVSAELKAAA